MTGPEGTKQLLRESFETTDLVAESVVCAAGLSVSVRTPIDSPQAVADAAAVINEHVARS